MASLFPSNRASTGRKPEPGESQRGVAFREQMKQLAHKLAVEQGMYTKPLVFKEPEVAIRHTCEKSPLAWRRDGPCAECQYELQVRNRLTELLGPPVDPQKL